MDELRLQLTNLWNEKMEALARHDWRKVDAIGRRINALEWEIGVKEAEAERLARQLWPGSKVTE